MFKIHNAYFENKSKYACQGLTIRVEKNQISHATRTDLFINLLLVHCLTYFYREYILNYANIIILLKF